MRPSFEIFQRSARLGWIFGVSLLRSKSSSLLKTVSATAEYSTPLEYRPGSKPAGLPSEQSTSVLLGNVVCALNREVLQMRPSMTPRLDKRRISPSLGWQGRKFEDDLVQIMRWQTFIS